jgi:HD-GYP domain-containing protein (c-di-GMP phosphodiesterase class II)
LAYDPTVADAFLDRGQDWLAAAGEVSAWEAVLAAEPQPWAWVGMDRLDAILHAFADFVDLKSPYTRGHSPAVAALVEATATHAGLSGPETTELRRAAFVHDLGRAGIPNGILDKPGPLSRAEWERVRLHPYWSERILAHTGALQPLAALAGAHHERLDGSGYHRGSPAALLSPAARVLATANTYQALTQDRSYRPALSPEAAAQRLLAEADGGRLDREAVRCVLIAAGQRRPGQRRTWPAGLSEREVTVLRHIARGASYKEVAAHLSISPKTAEHHVGHIYAKLGVSSRAAAALFAMEHNLLA